MTSKAPTPLASEADNHILIDETCSTGYELKIKGTQNTLRCEPHVNFKKFLIEVEGDNNTVLIGHHCRLNGRVLVKGTGITLTIGHHTTFQNVYVLAGEDCNVTIGNHCMFSRHVEIRTTDAHSLIDKTTRKRVNLPAPITIGNHVWIAANVMVSKGVTIADDCIIGAYSFVNRSIDEESVVAAGSPAKIVKRNVTWNRSVKPKFTQGQILAWQNEE
jgi:acetyltransferase-like isoleucine patch superfamily enzyme